MFGDYSQVLAPDAPETLILALVDRQVPKSDAVRAIAEGVCHVVQAPEDVEASVKFLSVSWWGIEPGIMVVRRCGQLRVNVGANALVYLTSDSERALAIYQHLSEQGQAAMRDLGYNPE